MANDRTDLPPAAGAEPRDESTAAPRTGTARAPRRGVRALLSAASLAACGGAVWLMLNPAAAPALDGERIAGGLAGLLLLAAGASCRTVRLARTGRGDAGRGRVWTAAAVALLAAGAVLLVGPATVAALAGGALGRSVPVAALAGVAGLLAVVLLPGLNRETVGYGLARLGVWGSAAAWAAAGLLAWAVPTGALARVTTDPAARRALAPLALLAGAWLLRAGLHALAARLLAVRPAPPRSQPAEPTEPTDRPEREARAERPAARPAARPEPAAAPAAPATLPLPAGGVVAGEADEAREERDRRRQERDRQRTERLERDRLRAERKAELDPAAVFPAFGAAARPAAVPTAAAAPAGSADEHAADRSDEDREPGEPDVIRFEDVPRTVEVAGRVVDLTELDASVPKSEALKGLTKRDRRTVRKALRDRERLLKRAA